MAGQEYEVPKIGQYENLLSETPELTGGLISAIGQLSDYSFGTTKESSLTDVIYVAVPGKVTDYYSVTPPYVNGVYVDSQSVLKTENQVKTSKYSDGLVKVELKSYNKPIYINK